MMIFLPCAFCGSENTVVLQEPAQIPDRAKLGHSRFAVTCIECGARGPWCENVACGQAFAQVIEKWNERAERKRVQ